jgi:hypothetical protein
MVCIKNKSKVIREEYLAYSGSKSEDERSLLSPALTAYISPATPLAVALMVTFIFGANLQLDW